MMANIIKTYSQDLPAIRFIGKKYGDEDRVNGSFGTKWGECFAPGGVLEQVEKVADAQLFEDAGAYIGLMCHKDGEPFVYAIGMFCPADTPVPEGLDFIDFAPARWGIGWIYGNESKGELYGHENEVFQKCRESGIVIRPDEDNAYWFFERYVCPRYTSPDEQGNQTLDIGFLAVGE